MANQNLNITIRAFDKTKKALSSATKGVRKVGGAVLNAKTAIVGLVGTAGFGALIKRGLAAGDSLAKTADKIGVTTEALAGMRHAAELTGVSTETMDMALQRFTRRASEAAIGTGEAKGALQELGINAKELVKLPLDQQMEIVADAMGNLSTQSDRVRIAMKLFDSEGVALVNTLGGGSDALREMIQEAEHLGLALSRTDTAQIEAANDSFTRAKGVITGLTNQFTIAFAPILQTIADSFRQSALDSADFGNVGQRAADALVGAFAKVQGALHGVRIFVTRLELGFTILGAYIAQRLVPILGTFLTVYNKIAPLLGKKIIENPLVGFAEDAKESVKLLSDELKLMQEIDPAANILQAYEAIKVKSRETAEQIAADKNAQTEASKNADAEKTRWQIYQDDIAKQSATKRTEWDAMNLGEQTKHATEEMSKLLSGTARHSKKLFAIQKAASIAKAVIKTYEGAQMAIGAYPPPINFAMAAATVAAGMANVAAIKAQSFDGGGFTGRGARSGGIDGKGGFPAILHPNETVIDHTKGGGQGVVVNQTINITTGVQQTVRAEIQNLLPQISDAAKSAVLNETRRRGSYSTGILGR